MGILKNIFKKGKKEVIKKPAPKKAPVVVKEKEVAKPPVGEKSLKEGLKKDKKEIKQTTPFAHKILVRPLVTEKATYLGTSSKYVFEIAPGVSKIDVAKAVESVYGVRPIKINIMNMSGKDRKYGRSVGRTKNWRKAIITLKSGDKIEIYEGV
ncbi:MAG: 50S ribosomal protein L23 [Patescibacteria group bacterium]|nr:50S ribosomal protein L23 [Patescibacteria group bacterium]MDD5490193.1 50S ribosomal protein L23 [Patescibacteria group bacterium]